MTEKQYDGYIMDIFQGDVEAIKTTEKACNNIALFWGMLNIALRQYIEERMRELNG